MVIRHPYPYIPYGYLHLLLTNCKTKHPFLPSWGKGMSVTQTTRRAIFLNS
jgi:hypothetical protein